MTVNVSTQTTTTPVEFLNFYNSKKNRFIVAFSTQAVGDSTVVNYAISRHNPKDRFNRVLAKDIALSRLVKKPQIATFPTTERSAIHAALTFTLDPSAFEKKEKSIVLNADQVTELLALAKKALNKSAEVPKVLQQVQSLLQ